MLGAPYEVRSALYEILGPDAVRVREDFPFGLIAHGGGGERLTEPLPKAPQTPAPSGAPALETRTWESPAAPSHGLCKIIAGTFKGLLAKGGSVVSELDPLQEALGQPYLTCATTSYSYNGEAPIDAYVEIDAVSPGSTGAPIATLEPAEGWPGDFEATLPDGYLVGRQLHGGWLLIEGGRDLQQRLVLLEDLHASIELGRRSEPRRPHARRTAHR